MRGRWLFVLTLAGLLSGCALLEAAQSQPSSPASELMAKVNGVPFTRADLNKRIALVQLSTWLVNGTAPADLDEGLYVDKWIDSELMAHAAANAGFDANESDGQQEVARLP